MNPIQKMLKPVFLTKAKKINKECSKYVKGKVIDIGAGRCYVAKELQEKNKVDVTCIDVRNLNQTSLKLTVYDGKKIPFKDNDFDTALIAYVLHHCENQLQIVKEAMRVCKGNIIIFEDTKLSPHTKAMDFLSNKFRGIKTPLKFHSEREWFKIFNDLGLKTVSIKRHVEKEWFYPLVDHTMFVLEKW